MDALSATEVAAELGRSKDWLYANWKKLVRDRGMPPPLHAPQRGAELVWSRVQFFAWLDKDLSPEMKNRVAAIRTAIEAFKGNLEAHEQAEIAKWRAHLDEKFGH